LSKASWNIDIIHIEHLKEFSFSFIECLLLDLTSSLSSDWSTTGCRKLLLLSSCHEQLEGLGCLGCEVSLISQQLLEVNNILINQHASDSACVCRSECLFNDLIDRVTNELLSVNWVSKVINFGNIDLRKREQRDLLNWSLRNTSQRCRLLRARSHTWLLSASSIAAIATLATATTTAAASVVTSVVLVTTLRARLIVTLSLRALLIVRWLTSTDISKKSVKKLLSLSIFAALLFLLLLVLGYPHLNSQGLAASEESLLIKSLNGLLSILNSVVHNVSILRLEFNISKGLN